MERVDRHRGILHKVAMSYARDEMDRQDLEQDILVQLWSAYPSYDPNRTFSTWMYRVALNVAISHVRKASRRPEVPGEWTDEWPPATPDGSPEDEQLAQLRRFLAGLDELHRALMLLYLDRYTHADIAEALGISESNVAVKIHRIKRQLKQHFNPTS